MQEHCSETDDFFAAVETENADIDAALKNPNITTGRSGRGITTIGLFGGKATTDNPEKIRAAGDDSRGISFIKRVARAVQDIDEFDGTARFPREIDDAIYSRSSRTDPFGAYRLTIWLGDLDHRVHEPVMDGLVEYFETEANGRNDIRAIEFDFDGMNPEEKFRAVFPWAMRESELMEREDVDDYEAPKPIYKLVRDLQKTPMSCRDFRRLDVTIHYYNPRQDRDGKYDREFQLDDFYGAEEQRLVSKDRRSCAEQALDNSVVDKQNAAISYELRVQVPQDEIGALLKDDDHTGITSLSDVGRHLGRTHHANTYDQPAQVTVGVVDTLETEDAVTFTLNICAS